MTKISDLTALTGAGVDTAVDLLPIVDMSAAGSARNKKITIAEAKIALGVGAAIAELDDVPDVNAPTPANGDVLTWDSTPGEWVSAAPASGIAELDDIPDVNAPTPANGDVLTWDSTPGEWVPLAPTGGSNALDDLTDVDAPTPSDGDVLTFDSGSGDWVPAAPTGSGGWQQIGSAQNASSSATIDFTGIDPTAWDELELRAYRVVPATDATDLWLRVGTGGGPTWATGASDYSFAKAGLQGTAGAGAAVNGADTTFDAMQFPTTSMSNVAGETFNGKLCITGLAAGEYCQCEGLGSTYRSDNAHQVMKAAGRYNATTAITALRVMCSSGNIASGKFVLFGRPIAV